MHSVHWVRCAPKCTGALVHSVRFKESAHRVHRTAHRSDYRKERTHTLMPSHDPKFTIENVSVGLGNKTRYGQPAFAECHVSLGPFRLRANLNHAGDLDIDNALHDQNLRLEITIAFRHAVVQELTERFNRRNEYDRRKTETDAPVALAKP